MPDTAVITLTTDFGQADGYVGTMKGVILGIAPGAVLVDLSHEVGPQQIAEGALVLWRAYPYFPPQTVHLAVVDPGVGSRRRPVLITTPRGAFVGPDNGLFSFVLDAEPSAQAYHLDVPAYWRPTISTTFHGRDLFAPSAAHLARGVPAAALGHPVALTTLVRLPPLQPEQEPGRVRGRIIHIDHFGNAITNIPAEAMAGLAGAPTLVVQVGPHRLAGIHPTYSDVPEGAPVALIGSEGLLEIGVRNGSAARGLGLAVGMAVECRGAPPAAPAESA